MLNNSQKTVLFWIWKTVSINVALNNLFMYFAKYDNKQPNSQDLSPVSIAILMSGAVTFGLVPIICLCGMGFRCAPYMQERDSIPERNQNEAIYALMTLFFSSALASLVPQNHTDRKSLILITTLAPIAVGALASLIGIHEIINDCCKNVCRLFTSRQSGEVYQSLPASVADNTQREPSSVVVTLTS